MNKESDMLPAPYDLKKQSIEKLCQLRRLYNLRLEEAELISKRLEKLMNRKSSQTWSTKKYKRTNSRLITNQYVVEKLFEHIAKINLELQDRKNI